MGGTSSAAVVSSGPTGQVAALAVQGVAAGDAGPVLGAVTTLPMVDTPRMLRCESV